MNVATEYRAGVFALTGICGLIDVACFVAIGGVFAELMTGNLLLVGISIGTRQFDPSTAALYASAIVPFLLGAFAAGLLTNRRPSHGPRIIGYPVEYVCIVTGTAIAVLTHPTQITTPGLSRHRTATCSNGWPSLASWPLPWESTTRSCANTASPTSQQT